jgi:hypothetical protein
VRADPEAAAYDRTARRRAEPSEERFSSDDDDDDDDDATRADDVNGVVTDVAFETLNPKNPKNDFMRRTDWAPMGIMDTDENISVGEIVARARSALAPASEKENAREKENDAGETGHAETERLAARATRRRAPPPGPPAWRLRRRRGGEAGGVHPASRKRFSRASRKRGEGPGGASDRARVFPSRVPARRVRGRDRALV